MQLVAYGAQDIYLSGNPQITFFKVVYRRHTNFAMESIGQIFNSTTDFGKKVSCIVPRNGDLIHKMYLEIKLPALKQDQPPVNTNEYCEWVHGIGNALIKSVSVLIGGQLVDKHYGEWLDIWGELTMDGNVRNGYDTMVGNYPYSTRDAVTSNARHPRTLYVPLQFWFNKYPGLALPLIALQYHEVEIKVEFESIDKLTQTGPKSTGTNVGHPLAKDGSEASMLSCRLFIDYIYLDTDERRRFAQVSHEYLIEQLQHTGPSSLSAGQASERINLNFNHPVKSLHWVIQPTTYLQANSLDDIQEKPSSVSSPPTTEELQTQDDTGKNWGGNQKTTYNVKKSTDGKNDTFSTAKIMLNGHDRMAERDADYYRVVQNCQHMPNYPSKTIYTYSFCLNPAEHQPSGTCNFSRIDNAVMPLSFTSNQSEEDRVIKVFGINYNVLRIMSGMGGLAYSN